MALDSNRYVKGNVKKSGAPPPMLHARRLPCRPHGVIEVVLGQEEFSFPTVLPVAVNVVSLGEFLAPWLLTGLPGLITLTLKRKG